jgi:WD40 repeat protein
LANPSASVNIISGGLDRNIIAWDTQQETNQVIPIHTSKTGIYSLATNNSGSTIVYGGPDGLLKILDTRISQADSKSGVSLTGMYQN